GFMGPGIGLTGQLTAGANYHVSVAARLVAGQAATGLKVTVMRSFADGTNAFDSVVSSTQVTDQAWVTLQGNYSFASGTSAPTGGSSAFDQVVSASVTDQAWVTMTGIYSFSTDNSGLIFYVQTSSGNASYYIDAVSVTQVAPPPGPPGNTAGASSTFESQTTEGWRSRTGGETVAVTSADAHGGSFSLLTSNRTATFQGPSFDVTNVMFNGSTYHVALWAKLAPGSPDTQLRVSLDRKLGSAV